MTDDEPKTPHDPPVRAIHGTPEHMAEELHAVLPTDGRRHVDPKSLAPWLVSRHRLSLVSIRTRRDPMAGGTTARRMKRKQERSPKTVAARKGRDALAYDQNAGVDAFVTQLAKASPMQIVELERTGVSGRFIRDLSLRMDLPQNHMIKVLRLAKATTLKKAAAGEKVAGSGGQAALGVARLLGIAQQMAADSVRPEATGFDAGRWLGEWLERPQPSLGGRRPSEFLDTPTGLAIVERLLRSIESGSYQ